MPKLSIRYLGVIAAVLTVVSWALWKWAESLALTTFLEAWMPNVGSDLAFVAISLFVIDAARGRIERARREPLVKPAIVDIGTQLRSVVATAAFDYAATHRSNYERLPLVAPDVIEHWLSGLGTVDESRAKIGEIPQVVTSLNGVAQWIETRELDVRETLDDPAFSAAVRDFAQAARRNSIFASVTAHLELEQSQGTQQSERHPYLEDLAVYAKKLTVEYRRVASAFDLGDRPDMTAEDLASIEKAVSH
jgi:hypothetical protein